MRRLCTVEGISTFASLARVVGLALPANANTTELVMATVNNSHRLTMQKLLPVFERENPDFKVTGWSCRKVTCAKT